MITQAFLTAFWGIATEAVKLVIPIIAVKVGLSIVAETIGIKR